MICGSSRLSRLLPARTYAIYGGSCSAERLSGTDRKSTKRGFRAYEPFLDQRLEEHVWGVDIGSHSQLRAQVIQYSITAHNLRTYFQLVSILVQHQPKAIHNARCREMTRWHPTCLPVRTRVLFDQDPVVLLTRHKM